MHTTTSDYRIFMLRTKCLKGDYIGESKCLKGDYIGENIKIMAAFFSCERSATPFVI